MPRDASRTTSRRLGGESCSATYRPSSAPSNIHYGYVGTAAGFDEGVLLDGAGLEQIGSDLLRLRWPTYSAGIEGLRALDAGPDRNAISLGIELFSLVPSHISPHELVETILMTPGLATEPV